MVPEYDEVSTLQSPDFTPFLESMQRGMKLLGAACATPVVIGPVTMARLSRTKSTATMNDLLNKLLPIYTQLLHQIGDMGFKEIQIHEPVLVFNEENLLPLFKTAYPMIIANVVASKKVNINMVSFMEDCGESNYQWLISQPEIRTISLDFSTARSGHNLDFVTKYGFPADKMLGVGIVDARNVWKVIPSEITSVFTILKAAKVANIRIQTSGSLQYCPWDFELEQSEEMKNHPASGVLAFAVQKLDDVVQVAKSYTNPALLKGHEVAWEKFSNARSASLSPLALQANQRLQVVTEKELTRPEPYKIRRHQQLQDIPPLPTTTIGSFPQTAEIRRLRAQWKKGILTDDEYKAGIDQQIAFCIGIQEAIGLDVLVCCLTIKMKSFPLTTLLDTNTFSAVPHGILPFYL
jgi:5-methyltetrahydropteroyltriglutamate--homocysteine methyltransferase